MIKKHYQIIDTVSFFHFAGFNISNLPIRNHLTKIVIFDYHAHLNTPWPEPVWSFCEVMADRTRLLSLDSPVGPSPIRDLWQHILEKAARAVSHFIKMRRKREWSSGIRREIQQDAIFCSIHFNACILMQGDSMVLFRECEIQVCQNKKKVLLLYVCMCGWVDRCVCV